MTDGSGDGVGFRSSRGPLLVALMLTTGLVALDATVVATAVPSIVRDIGGARAFPWVFSVYVLAQAVAVPLASRTADVRGRRPVMLVGLAVFALGSLLCGIAWSMPALIASRVVQGAGAGIVQPMTVTITGDVYSVRERARVQAYLASVWAVASVIGPAVGGAFAAVGLWRFVFAVNLPVCGVAALVLVRTLRETPSRTRRGIDVVGAVLLAAASTLLLLGVLEGGVAWPWDSWQTLGAIGGGAILLVALVAVERRAVEPVLPPWLFTRPLLRTASLVSFGVGALTLGWTSSIPSYLEGVLGASPLVAGLAVAAQTLGWPVASAQSGRLALRIGARATIVLGTVVAFAGAASLAVAPHPGIVLVCLASFVLGLGLGFVMTPSLVAVQSAVTWSERGAASGTQTFSRAVGGALGVAVFGAIANAVYGGHAQPSPEVVESASRAVFVGVAVVAALTAAAAVALPRAARS